MKKLFILLIGILICLYSCIGVNEDKYTEEYGIVVSIDIYQKYNSTLHIYTDIYRIGVQYDDTLIYILDDKQPQLGDSVKRYIYKNNSSKLDDYEM